MKSLILTLTLLALAVSASNVMARDANYQALQTEWKVVQAQQKAVKAYFARIEREAAGYISGTSRQAVKRTFNGRTTRSKGYFCPD